MGRIARPDVPEVDAGFSQGASMTTIAYRDGVMAADTQETGDCTKQRAPKMVRLPCGGVAGGAGYVIPLKRGLAWLAKPKGQPPKLKGAQILVAYGDGRVGYYADKDWTFCEVHEPYAIGSGTQAAMAAMCYFQTSACEAVEAATTADPNTSGPVEVMRVQKRKRK